MTHGNITFHDGKAAHKVTRILDAERQTNFTWCDRCHGWYEPVGKRWPLFEFHGDVTCFNCTGKLPGQPIPRGGATDAEHNPPGHGRYRQYCNTCEMWTYYDIPE